MGSLFAVGAQPQYDVHAALSQSSSDVTNGAAPLASASARRNSSLRTLLPLSSQPVQSSRLIKSSQPGGRPGSHHACTAPGDQNNNVSDIL